MKHFCREEADLCKVESLVNQRLSEGPLSDYEQRRMSDIFSRYVDFSIKVTNDEKCLIVYDFTDGSVHKINNAIEAQGIIRTGLLPVEPEPEYEASTPMTFYHLIG